MDRLSAIRRLMVDEQIRRRGIRDPRLLEAFEAVPRHLFVPVHVRSEAYADAPLPIGLGQTISQPYIVALMTSLLELRGGERVLEVGTGSGYQAAILGRLAREVHTVECVSPLAKRAASLLRHLDIENVHVHEGDGGLGWAEAAPYSAVLVTAAAPRVPAPLLNQLADVARLVAPINQPQGFQSLLLLDCRAGVLTQQDIASVAFVPLRGKYGWQPTR